MAYADELLGQFAELWHAYQQSHRGVAVLGLTTDDRLRKIEVRARRESEFIRDNLGSTA